VSAAAATSIATLPPPIAPSPPPQQEPSDPGVGPDVNVDPNAENPDWTYDPNEPRYCICNQVSYGDMVACDNEDVSIALQIGTLAGTVTPQAGFYEIMRCILIR
jgi:inhibitor of growth protein 3